mgnify:CR=1 FL=1
MNILQLLLLLLFSAFYRWDLRLREFEHYTQNFSARTFLQACRELGRKSEKKMYNNTSVINTFCLWKTLLMDDRTQLCRARQGFRTPWSQCCDCWGLPRSPWERPVWPHQEWENWIWGCFSSIIKGQVETPKAHPFWVGGGEKNTFIGWIKEIT